MTNAQVRAPLADGYLPLKVLADYSGLSIRTLRNHLSNRLRPLPYHRIGGKILVRRSDFDAWASQFKVTALTTTVVDRLVDDVASGFR